MAQVLSLEHSFIIRYHGWTHLMQTRTQKVSIERVCLMEIGLTMAAVAAFLYIKDYDSLIFSLYYKDYQYDFK